ncbi:MAG: flavodoxin family protein [Chloroflexi bacterium]|uniref:Flavodoxin family protein n=1 Tax=Candidatus Chlorohelix allophototropha TaxID=3003348 RepID=A0A8T7M201_9CHLR|nr:flavodoxin family protein [Chloroflexota bacterium]WJW66787.1 flavodoxin family protein [Chloroflexota bacterium L227-S17]
MKALVIYDSKYGNTKQIAESVAKVIDGESVNVTDFNPEMLVGIDVVVVGSPINGWGPSPLTQALLTKLEAIKLKDKCVAAFDTGYRSKFSGNAAAKIMKRLISAGGKQLIPTRKFVVEHSEGPLGSDEIANANLWAIELKTQYERLVATA